VRSREDGLGGREQLGGDRSLEDEATASAGSSREALSIRDGSSATITTTSNIVWSKARMPSLKS
jgi:hypothetical protein